MSNENDLFLSEKELIQLTGFRQVSKQKHWLYMNNYHFISDGGASAIRLSRDYVKAKMMGKGNEV